MHEVWVVVAVIVLQHLDRHPKEPGGFPERYPALHQPRRRRMAKRMRHYLARQARKPDGALEALLDRRDRLAVEFHETVRDQF